MKRVFVVRGNHDGNIGVYSNIKRAYRSAFLYLDSNEGTIEVWNNDKTNIKSVKGTYKNVVKELARGYNCSMKYYDLIATIEPFYLND